MSTTPCLRWTSLSPEPHRRRERLGFRRTPGETTAQNWHEVDTDTCAFPDYDRQWVVGRGAPTKNRKERTRSATSGAEARGCRAVRVSCVRTAGRRCGHPPVRISAK